MMMQPEENSRKELEALQKIVPFAPFREIKTLHPFDVNVYYSALREKSFATSYGMGWKGLQAVRAESPGGEFSAVITPSTHVLGLSLRPPEKMELRYEGVKRDMPPLAGSIAVVPAGSSVQTRWQGARTRSSFILSRAWSRGSQPSRSNWIPLGWLCHRSMA